MSVLRAIWLFARIVFRRFDASNIPAPYRCDQRISMRTAWAVARIVHAPHRLGLGGENLAELVCDELDSLKERS